MTNLEYVESVILKVSERNSHEQEFNDAVKEVLLSLVPVLDQHPEWVASNLLSRVVEPERMIHFRISWVDDQGQVQVNRGFRVQFNNALGPYKGGLRLHPSVNASIVKFLGFEQIFKNALTGLPIGGAKGGSDFDPKGKTDSEVMRFCQAFMSELYKYIGADTDVPAGDIGVGAREIGYLYGYYSKIKSISEQGVLTGKSLSYGGSLVRKEATGYGLIYFVDAMLKDQKMSLENKTVIVSGSGNVAIYAIEKLIQRKAKVVACSDSSGYIYDPKGINLSVVKKIKEEQRGRISDYLIDEPKATFHPVCNDIWSIPCDIALPCATQGEINLDSAMLLVKNGCKLVAEGANMPSTLDAIEYFIKQKILFGPAKAANAGGVACSALEMSQNSMRLSWTFAEVDAKLLSIMQNIYDTASTTAKAAGHPGNLVLGANIAGFTKVANAMMMHGIL